MKKSVITIILMLGLTHLYAETALENSGTQRPDSSQTDKAYSQPEDTEAGLEQETMEDFTEGSSILEEEMEEPKIEGIEDSDDYTEDQIDEISEEEIEEPEIAEDTNISEEDMEETGIED